MTSPVSGPRLAYLVNQYPSPSHTFIRREIQALESQGLPVLRFTIRRAARLVDAEDLAERERTHCVLEAGLAALLGAGLRDLCTRPGRFLRAAVTAWRLARQSPRGLLAHAAYLLEACLLRGWLSRQGVEHVHAHFGTNSAAVALLCARLGGPGYSMTVHGPDEFDRPAALSLGEKVRHARFAVAISTFGRSQLCRWSRTEDWSRIHVVRCGVDRGFLGAPPSDVPASPKLCWVGRLAAAKGLPVLLEAAGMLAARGIAFELAIVGEGPLRPELEARIAAAGLGTRVRLLGWQAGDATREQIDRSRALVMSSFAEGLPVVLMEAFARGRPVVATRIAGIPELVRDGESGWLVTAGSAEELAAVLERVLGTDPARLTAMGARGRALVEEMHDVRREAAKLAAHIRAACAVTG